ncbi:MAG: hypothetical protein AAF226_14510 [Verrucomicrobiota bacterium]
MRLLADSVSLGLLFLRHLLAIIAIAVLVGVLWTVGYVVLIFCCSVADGDMGGPLLYPMGLLLFVGLSAGIAAVIFAPVCIIGSVACRFLKLPPLLGIPISFFSMVIALAGWLFFLEVHKFPELIEKGISFPLIVLAASLMTAVPLGIYWWLTEGPLALWDLFKQVGYWIKTRLRSARQQKAKSQHSISE